MLTANSPSRRLKAVFLGTPEFAIPSLRAVLDVVEVLAVVTQPDRPRGRGRQVAPPPVAAVARALGFRVLQPTRLNDPAVLDTLRALRPDIIITFAYGKIIPPAILTLPPLGCINVHPSLLPKYRGPVAEDLEGGGDRERSAGPGPSRHGYRGPPRRRRCRGDGGGRPAGDGGPAGGPPADDGGRLCAGRAA